jgi:MFS family permease
VFVLKPLSRRPIALLWGGQVLSAIGDEIYRVALVWLAIELVGDRAGYLGAVQSASLLIFGVLGGAWADRWDHRRTMIGVDTVRGIAVLVPPVFALFHPLSVWVLVPVAIVVSSLGAFFDPALQAAVPELAHELELRQATTGLLDATRRVARVVGPGLVALLNRFLPLIQFFTLDAVSFAFSAVSVAALHQELPAREPAPKRPGAIARNLLESYRLLRGHDLLFFAIVFGCGVTWSMWGLGMSVGLGLLLHQRMPTQVGAFGLILASYGLGNLLSNLVVGSLPIRRPERTLFVGLMVVGAGLTAMALAPSLPAMAVAAACAAIGGPMDDLSLLSVLQSAFRGNEIARIYRLLLAHTSGCTLVAFLLSPLLFDHFSAQAVTTASGVAILGVGLVGFCRFGIRRGQNEPDPLMPS